MRCSFEDCGEGAVGVADVQTPSGRKLKPLCREHQDAFKEGLAKQRKLVERTNEGMFRAMGTDWELMCERLAAAQILSLEKGLEIAQVNPGLLAVPEGGGGDDDARRDQEDP